MAKIKSKISKKSKSPSSDWEIVDDGLPIAQKGQLITLNPNDLKLSLSSSSTRVEKPVDKGLFMKPDTSSSNVSKFFPELYPLLKMNNAYSSKNASFENAYVKNNYIIPEDGTPIELTSGRFKGAKVSPKILNDLLDSAKKEKIDPWLLASIVGRESTFGSGTEQNRERSGGRDQLISGWNVSENYQPYKVERYLADKKVPGLKTSKTPHGWFNYIEDEKKVNDYLLKNPKIVEEYYSKLEKTPNIGNLNAFDLAARFIKQKGIKGYNPGDPRYAKMVQEDLKLLKSDPNFKKYMNKKGYQQGGNIPIDPMGYLNPDNYDKPAVIIPSNEISMERITDRNILGISNTGDMQYMEPGGKYSYDGSYVTEYPLPEAGGGYRVIRSNERKGKTHKVIGPGGKVKFFGDSKLGQHPKDPARKKAFYARHKKNLAKNPYFRAFARKTWAEGGMLPDLAAMAFGGLHKAQDGFYNMQRALELGYNPDDQGHWPSVDSETGMWLKSKEHPTAWMEYLYGYSLNPEVQKNFKHPVVNPEGYFGENQLQYIPKQAFGGNLILEKYKGGGSVWEIIE